MDLESNYDTLKKIKVSQNHVVKHFVFWGITQHRMLWHDRTKIKGHGRLASSNYIDTENKFT